ncbi:MAG: ketopantoate reductase family protein [Epsilonproteobacteria bacterium]|nr:ketopantoate reductase family protein [Campylobacterota bacterium]
MRVLVIGAGGVGGYLAAKLAQCGIDTTIFATPKTNEFIAKNGLKVTGVEEFSICLKTKLEGIYDIIIIATKSYHLDDVIPILKAHSNKDTIVLPLLNGVKHFEKLKEFNLKKGCIYIVSHKKDINIIEKKSDTFYLCYEKDDKLDELFSKCDLKVKSSENIDFDIWRKYLFIATFAALTSFYKKPMGWVIENKENEVVEFVKRMMKFAPIKFDEQKEIARIIKQAKNIPYDSKTSMQIDFENNNQTELENIIGYLKDDEFINKFYLTLHKQH